MQTLFYELQRNVVLNLIRRYIVLRTAKKFSTQSDQMLSCIAYQILPLETKVQLYSKRLNRKMLTSNREGGRMGNWYDSGILLMKIRKTLP